MKQVLIVVVLILAVATRVQAAFKMPKSAYRMEALEEAKAEALEKRRPITFIYTTENTSCGLCAYSSKAAADTLRTKSVVVYANSDKDWAQLPGIVRAALSAPEAGRFIPKTVILDPEMTKVIATVPYARGQEQDKLLKQAKKDLAAAMPKRSSLALAPPKRVVTVTLPVDENREMRTWHSKSGAEVTASLLKEAPRYLVLKKEDGGQLQIAAYKLSDADQQYVEGLKNALRDDGTRE